MVASERKHRTRRHFRRLLSALGPGLMTGAADDDPSGIATYSQAGAQFGFGLTWTMFLTLPFMAAIQICIGWQTRKGLAGSSLHQVKIISRTYRSTLGSACLSRSGSERAGPADAPARSLRISERLCLKPSDAGAI
jgi:hypothetical protein